MILLDTHTWFWWHEEPDKLSSKVAKLLDSDEIVAISPASCWELALLLAKGRLELHMPIIEWAEESRVLRGLEIIPISLNIAALAGGQDLALHPVPGDRFLAATSIVYDIPLVTRDQRLHEAEQVNTIW